MQTSTTMSWTTWHRHSTLSTTLAATLASSGESAVSHIFGPGLVDMTRLAMSAPDLWVSILETNKPSVLEGLKLFQSELHQAVSALESGDIMQLFTKAANFSRKIREKV